MIELWHNPRCSKSRAALALLQDRGIDPVIRLYLKDPPSVAEIESARRALGAVAVITMMRPGEAVFKELGLSKSDPDSVLIAAMSDHPILIERPLALSGNRAVLGRPPEAVLDLI